MIIIGITGTIGSGKGVVVAYLCEKYGFVHYSVRNFLVAEIERRGLPMNRDSMALVGNDLREKNHSGFIVEQLFLQALLSGKNAVIESIRTVGEIETLKKHKNFSLVAIDADVDLRYKRIVSRKSVTDNISFEKFLEEEKREMQSSDPNKQNIKACVERADVVIKNTESFEDLYKKIDSTVKSLGIVNF